MATSTVIEPARASTSPFKTGAEVRIAARDNAITLTSGLAPSYLQANLIVLPSCYAEDFRLLCARNPVPCPLLAESARVGSYEQLKSHVEGIYGQQMASSLDVRQDVPLYMVYEDGRLVKSHTSSIVAEWGSDHVAFLIGCSYSFETALCAAGLTPRHTLMQRNVPMYRTNIPLCPAGVFSGSTYVVSMRPYRKADVGRARDITRPFVSTHGEPVAWGWEAVKELGIKDINTPEWGDSPLTLDGRPLSDKNDDVVPIFWGCGVTPQEAVMKAALDGTVMAHAPGHMLLLDITETDVCDILSAEIQS